MHQQTLVIEPNGSTRHQIGELWRYRDLIGLFVKRDFTAKYKQTILGPLWHFIQPILTTAVSVLLFNVVANIGTQGVHPIAFQMAGIIIWNYFAACLINTSNTFIANAGIFGKVYFPRLVSPVSVVISQLIQFGIQLILLLLVLAGLYLSGVPISIHQQSVGVTLANYLLIPVILLLMAGLGLGIGIIISSVTTKYRDLIVLVGFGVQLLMFASAVNYPLSTLEKISEKHPFIFQIIRYNPLSVMVELFRNAILGLPIHYEGIAYTAIWAAALLLFGFRMFSRVERSFMDSV